MIRPLIGITAGHIAGDSDGKRGQSDSVGSRRAYLDVIVRAGGAPLLLPPTAERASIRAAMSVLDGLLLTGGGDVAPSEYDAKRSPKTRCIDRARDRTEIRAVRLALGAGQPVLAICRGIQVLNVALGGDLIQDIETEIAGAIRHCGSDPTPTVSHTITVEANNLLASLIGAGEVEVNSSHHQAAGQLGKGLRVVARAPDGVVEAIEMDDRSPALGVQFHPERMAEEQPRFQTLFNWFVEQARRCRKD
ncbi:gamma-glutamyl-gamma-aminobutyrate hydrolase family protein, partial [Candidatus Sumerlaeota bacterium]|nr:gamma-glutamyl-gamma-aminobutyrate hydrolase family protein [Candidatus Sumerlaeota bacterium]